MLKALEEPAAFAHLILISSEPEALAETIVSRCQPVEFAVLPAAAVEAALASQGEADEVAAAARLAAGDLERAGFLLSDAGRGLRAQAEACAAAALEGESSVAAWRGLLDGAERAGEEAESAARAALEAEAEEGVKRSARELSDEAKRSGRRRRTEVLDLGLELCGAWFRDLAAVSAEAPDVVFNRDRVADLERQGASISLGRARGAVELIADTRRRLDLNVSEELALEALFSRLDRVLAGA
jgi:DNA polymerase-3 subunit delta'